MQVTTYCVFYKKLSLDLVIPMPAGNSVLSEDRLEKLSGGKSERNNEI